MVEKQKKRKRRRTRKIDKVEQKRRIDNIKGHVKNLNVRIQNILYALAQSAAEELEKEEKQNSPYWHYPFYNQYEDSYEDSYRNYSNHRENQEKSQTSYYSRGYQYIDQYHDSYYYEKHGINNRCQKENSSWEDKDKQLVKKRKK